MFVHFFGVCVCRGHAQYPILTLSSSEVAVWGVFWSFLDLLVHNLLQLSVRTVIFMGFSGGSDGK